MFSKYRTPIILAAVVLLLLALLGWRSGCMAAKSAKSERNIAVATGTALDKVAAETPAIRQEQQQKEQAVDEIQGSDQRLPDGFGAGLEQLRNHGKHPHP